MHGIYQITEDVWQPLTQRINDEHDTSGFIWHFLRALKTFILVDIAWVFFRADSIKAAVHILRKSVAIDNINLILEGGLTQLGLDGRNIIALLLALLVLLVVSILKENGVDALECLTNRNILLRYLFYWILMTFIIFSLNITGQEFIYYQF